MATALVTMVMTRNAVRITGIRARRYFRARYACQTIRSGDQVWRLVLGIFCGVIDRLARCRNVFTDAFNGVAAGGSRGEKESKSGESGLHRESPCPIGDCCRSGNQRDALARSSIGVFHH